jgi:hypothetical protein
MRIKGSREGLLMPKDLQARLTVAAEDLPCKPFILYTKLNP